MALLFPDESGVTSRAGGGSAFFVRRQLLPATVFNLIMKTTIVLCVAAFSLFAAVFQTKADIIAGPIKNPTNGNYYYLLSPNIWTASEAEAESIGGTLAIIKNADEQKWVFSTFNAYDGVNHVGIWIGLHRTTLGGPFAWVTGAKLDYTNWNQGEPNNVGGIENCVHMSSGDSTAPGTWNDLPDNTFNDRKYGVVELSGNADGKTLSKEERALIGTWYEGGKLERPCWIAGTDNVLFVIPNNRFAGRASLCADGSLFVPKFQNGLLTEGRIFGGYYPLPQRARTQMGMRGEIVQERILWSDGTWWSRRPSN